MSTIPHPMQKLGRHHDIMSMVIRSDTIIIFPVMGGLETTIYRPWVYQWAFLNIVCKKQAVQFGIVPAFISICPENDRGMVFRYHHHFLNELRPCWRIVVAVPPAQLVHHIASQ